MRKTNLVLAAAFYAAGAASAAILLAPTPTPGAAFAAERADPAKAIAALESRVANLEAAMAKLTAAVSVTSSGNVTITANKLKLNAPQLEVSSATAQFGGTIKAKTLQVDSVIAKSYTPGAGNTW